MKTLILLTWEIIHNLYLCLLRTILIWTILWFGLQVIRDVLVHIRVHGL